MKQFNISQDEKRKQQIFHCWSNGWTSWLANLRAYLEHDILLTETDIDLRSSDSAGYEFVNI